MAIIIIVGWKYDYSRFCKQNLEFVSKMLLLLLLLFCLSVDLFDKFAQKFVE